MRYAVILLLFLASCRPADPAATYLNTEADYVGIDACASCHPDKAATFRESQMGRSWEPATLANSAADFDNPEPVYDPHRDLYYRPFTRDGSLYVEEYRLADADTTYRRVEEIDYIVGSGHHTNSHIMDVGGYLYQMPLTWYVQDGRWDLPPGFADGNNIRFSRPITLKCITCHNAMPDYVPGSENRYLDVPDGIDCERCHGPGSVHVEAMRAGRVVNVATETDYTIVNPAKLPFERQFDLCQGCHMQGAAVTKSDRTFADFRPSMALSDIENVFWPRYADSLHQFVMASHPDRLMQSACFEASREAAPLTCTTCHDPHVSIETLGPDHYTAVCQGCHAEAQVAACPEESADCTSCHMPVSGSSDIPHVRITDHFIRRPDREAVRLVGAEEFEDQKRFVRLASLIAENPPPGEIALGYMTYFEEVTNHPGFLDSAAVLLEKARREDPGADLGAALVRLHFLRGDHVAVVGQARSMAAMPDAWTAYRIGEAFLTLNAPQEAIAYLEDALAMAPAHLRFMSRLASGYSQAGRQAEAITLFDRILDANPKQAGALSDRGFAHVLSQNAEAAEADFLAALALDPDLEMGLANLASLYFNTGRADRARPYARRLVALDPANARYRRLWELVE